MESENIVVIHGRTRISVVAFLWREWAPDAPFRAAYEHFKSIHGAKDG